MATTTKPTETPVVPETEPAVEETTPAVEPEVEPAEEPTETPVVPEVVAEDAPEVPAGCETCDNTGLEVGVPLDEAKVCPTCNGSPFGEPKES